jgi:hypothetical protein
VPGHDFHEGQCARDVLPVVGERDTRGFTHRFQPGKMHHRRQFMLGEYLIKGGVIIDIQSMEYRSDASNLLDASQHFNLTVAQIVHHHRKVARRNQFNTHMTADITSSTGYQNFRLKIVG